MVNRVRIIIYLMQLHGTVNMFWSEASSAGLATETSDLLYNFRRKENMDTLPQSLRNLADEFLIRIGMDGISNAYILRDLANFIEGKYPYEIPHKLEEELTHESNPNL